MQFCPQCSNIMDISKTIKSSIGIDPTSLSLTTDTSINNNDLIKKVINMYKNNIPITNEQIDESQLLKHPDYISLKDKDNKDL